MLNKEKQKIIDTMKHIQKYHTNLISLLHNISDEIIQDVEDGEKITKRNLIDALENIRYTTAIADIEEYDSFYLALEDLENL